MKKTYVAIVVIAILVLGFFGYFGFIPGISYVMGANKPMNLGIKYTKDDLDKGRSMTGVELQDLTQSSKTLEFSGSKSISGEYSNEIITAMINSAKYKYYPVTNAQVKISSDGIIETSGNFNIDKAIKWSSDLGSDTSFSSEAKKYVKYVPNNPSFYLKGKMSVNDNQISVDISQAKISRFTAPESIIKQYQGQLADFVESRISAIPEMKIKSADFSSGKLKLDGTYPAQEKSTK